MHRPILMIETFSMKNLCFSIPTDVFTLVERLFAYEKCTGERITDIEVIGPAGLKKSSILQSSSNLSVWFSALTWTPNSNQKGSNLMCVTAKSTSLLSSIVLQYICRN